VNAGANVLLVQTNNATFGYTDESEQQLAISRVRAVEHGRSIVHVSTVGVSSLITPEGTAHQQSALFTSALLAGELPLRTASTVADRVGGWPEYLACGAVLLLLVVRALRLAPRRRR
jgi:apolipoprotein N-acyltransferase